MTCPDCADCAPSKCNNCRRNDEIEQLREVVTLGKIEFDALAEQLRAAQENLETAMRLAKVFWKPRALAHDELPEAIKEFADLEARLKP